MQKFTVQAALPRFFAVSSFHGCSRRELVYALWRRSVRRRDSGKPRVMVRRVNYFVRSPNPNRKLTFIGRLSIKEKLIDPNNLDVIVDTWSTSRELEAELNATLQPCEWFAEPYTLAWKQSIVASEPRFQLVGDTLYTIGAGETKHVVEQYYRLWHSSSLLLKHRHKLVVRARLDSLFLTEVKLPEKPPPNSVYALMEWLYGYDAGESEPLCPKMMNDLFAYGDYWGMRNYNDVFPYMFRILDEMRADPGFRLWWEVGNARAPGTFLSNAESFLAWRLRLAGVNCKNIALPLCVYRRRQDGVWAC